MHDWDLIKAYREAARSNSEADQKRAETAFSELVHRHLNLVFSAALRSLRGNHSLAEDVAQKTFSLLASKAHQFSPSLSIVGWLYRTTCNISRDALRAENRRRARELEALHMHSQSTVDSSPDSRWEDIAPLLEQAMASLPENERVLILLRFFERKPFREVAEALHITEEAARMRASRALQKLRAFFSQRGVTISSIAIGNVLLASAVSAAPAALATSLAVPLKLTTASIPLSFTTKWILMTTLQKSAIITAALLLVIGAASAFQTAVKSESLNVVVAAKSTFSAHATQSVTQVS
ncbi:MAG: RNA polymerase sigma factor, partial [Limisphaerales bacterium]